MFRVVNSLAGMALLLASMSNSAAVVLQYHHVADDTPAITSISPDAFEKQMVYLHREGFNVVSAEALASSLRAGSELPDRSIVLTFDDAYRDILENAMPILVRFGFPFSVFVATGLVGTSSHYLTWSQLRTMQSEGVDIANHTVTHAHLLRRLPRETRKAWLLRISGEITQAKLDLDQHLEHTSKLFAYPYGEYNADVAELIGDLGYVAFGQQSGAVGANADLTALPRFPISGEYAEMTSFGTKVHALALPVSRTFVDPLLPVNTLRPSLHLIFSQPQPSLSALACYGPSGRTDLEIDDLGNVIATASEDIPVGRSRYNCTMPAADGRYYWHSQLWIRRNTDGSWYPEP